jgi:hypothetical protein
VVRQFSLVSYAEESKTMFSSQRLPARQPVFFE